MASGVVQVLRYIVMGSVILAILTYGYSMAAPSPTINITGNDNFFVWGTVQNLEHSLHYIVMVYVKNTDGKWYGPKSPGNDTFTEISADHKWKCNYNSDFQGSSGTTFKAFIVEKGESTDEVLINGAKNLSLIRAHVIAETEAEKIGNSGTENYIVNNSSI